MVLLYSLRSQRPYVWMLFFREHVRLKDGIHEVSSTLYVVPGSVLSDPDKYKVHAIHHSTVIAKVFSCFDHTR